MTPSLLSANSIRRRVQYTSVLSSHACAVRNRTVSDCCPGNMLSRSSSRFVSRNVASLFSSSIARPMSAMPKIIYTITDEAPALATYSLLPIVSTFAAKAGIEMESCDISLAARIISSFPEGLNESQRIPDTLAALGELCKKPDANIIK